VVGADDDIRRTLEAHGLHWDAEAPPQSTRDEAYADALARLEAAGLLFRCTCTRRMLREAGDRYPGTCRGRGMTPVAGTAALRMRAAPERVRFEDRLEGPLNLPVGGDFVVRRRDGLWAYQLAVVVDDAAQGVTDVVRGIDLLDSTPRQIVLQQALGLPRPRWLHHGLVTWPDGTKLSKQTGAPGVPDDAARANVAAVLQRLRLPRDPTAPPTDQLAEALRGWRPGEALRAHPVVEPPTGGPGRV
jgi:glutamyl-Q tRNA(Asp) synthetase